MKIQALLLLVVAVVLTMIARKKGESVALSEKIKKVWTVQTATENGTVVFTKGAGRNSQNYAKYQLDLSKPPPLR